MTLHPDTLRPMAVTAAVLGLLMASSGVHAQTKGNVIGRLSITQIAPSVTSDDLTAPSLTGTKTDVSANTQLTGGVTWMYSDQIAFDLPLSLGFKHDLLGAGAIAGAGKIGEVKALPITVLAQYRFQDPSASLRPYVGLGPTYAKFYKARGTAVLSGLTGGSPSNPTTLEIDSRWGITAQVGVSVALAPRWSLDLSYLKTLLKTRATLSTGQTIDVTLNPNVYTVGVGYQF